LHKNHKVENIKNIVTLENDSLNIESVYKEFNKTELEIDKVKLNIENEINKINNLYDTTISNLANSFQLKHKQISEQENNLKEKLQNEVTKIKEELENNLSQINCLKNISNRMNKGFNTYKNLIEKLNYISKINIIKKKYDYILIKQIKSIEFSYKDDQNDIIFNEYYFNGICPPSNIEFKEITLFGLKITWKNELIKNINIKNTNDIKYILEIKEPNQEFKKIYEGSNDYYQFINISLKDNYEFRLCLIYNNLISPWTKAQKFNLSEMNNLKFIHRLNSNNGLRSWDNVGIINDGFIIVSKGYSQFGPYMKYKLGKYLVVYYGKNLNKAKFDVIDNHYKDKFELKMINQSDNGIKYEVEINRELFSGIEFRSSNNTHTPILIKYIEVYRFNN